MSVGNYGRQVANQVKDQVTKAIKDKLMPIIIQYVAPVVLVIVLIVGLIGSASGTSSDSGDGGADGGPGGGMHSATGTSWEQFKRYLYGTEGGTEITVYEGEECYCVQNGAVGPGYDIGTFGTKLINMGYSTTAGSYIPVSVIEPLVEEELTGHYEYVENTAIAAGINLTLYQKYALTSRTYNYGDAGGMQLVTSEFVYASNKNFVDTYNQYYSSINNENYYGDYTKTDFSNGLFTEYMTWLDYAPGNSMGGTPNTHPAGWETRRKSEWCLFQTGYYGWGLKNGGVYPVGFDEYCQETGGTIDYSFNQSDYVILPNAQKIQETATTNKYNQTESGYTDACLGFSFAYAHSINTNTTNKISGSISSEVIGNWDNDVYKSGTKSYDKEVVLRRNIR